MRAIRNTLKTMRLVLNKCNLSFIHVTSHVYTQHSIYVARRIREMIFHSTRSHAHYDRFALRVIYSSTYS